MEGVEGREEYAKVELERLRARRDVPRFCDDVATVAQTNDFTSPLPQALQKWRVLTLLSSDLYTLCGYTIAGYVWHTICGFEKTVDVLELKESITDAAAICPLRSGNGCGSRCIGGSFLVSMQIFNLWGYQSSS
jgi:hypothetical protein